MIKKKKHQLLLKNRLGRGYRIPTLNDRYWDPGGNPYLQPEESWSAEGGLDWVIRNNDKTAVVNVTYHHQEVNDWIQWTPVGSIWTSQNVQQVTIDGIEVSADFEWIRNGHQFNWSMNYSYTQSIITQDIEEYNGNGNRGAAR